MPLSAFPFFTVKGHLNNAMAVILHFALDYTHSELCFVFFNTQCCQLGYFTTLFKNFNSIELLLQINRP